VTRWPLCLAEIALYAVISGLVLAMGLDARDRWKQLRREEYDQEEHDDALERGDAAEVSTVRQKPSSAPDDTDPPPLAS